MKQRDIKMPVRKSSQVKDPVCDMYVRADQHSLNFHGIHLAFCSTQCRDRFKQNPGLYIGRPGTRAPRQEGMEIVKRRCFTASGEIDAGKIRAALSEMMGIKDISITARRIRITYDLLQVSARQLEDKLTDIGVHLSASLLTRIKRAWVHFYEDNILQSMEVNTDTDGGKSCH